MSARILVAGTADTKGEELLYLADQIREAGAVPVIADLGIGRPSISVDISNHDIAACDPKALSLLGTQDRGPAVAAMGDAFAKFCAAYNLCDAALGIGGGGGTSIVSAGFRAFPIGFPKLIVSTMASGQVARYVDISDIGLIYSVTDLAGLKRALQRFPGERRQQQLASIDQQVAAVRLVQRAGLDQREIGGEGRNFQFCHHLYLFDMPLHPDVLEQRIGRLDRIGQKDRIHIHAAYFEGTPEEVLLKWYEDGLDIFRTPWNGALLEAHLQKEIKEALRTYLDPETQATSRKKKLQSLLKNTKEWADTKREEQQKGVDLLVDITSFSGGRGVKLAEQIQDIEKQPDLRSFLEKAFNHFGVEMDKLDALWKRDTEHRKKKR